MSATAKVRAGTSLVEILVAIALIGALIGIIVPVIGRSRAKAQQSGCSANLHRLGQAFAAYAADNRGWVPRNPAQGFKNHPIWPVVLTKYFRRDPLNSWAEIATVKNYQCPSHPTKGIPTAFVLNSFSFETRDKPTPWWGSPAVQIAKVKSPSTLPWLLETPNAFIELFPGSVMDQIFQETAHGVHDPEHLAGGARARVSDNRHGKNSNLLYADGHVGVVHPGELKLEQFDDGIRLRDWSTD